MYEKQKYYLTDSFQNSELVWTKGVKEFIVLIISNTTRVATYYTSKPILRSVKNPKHDKFSTRDEYVHIRD